MFVDPDVSEYIHLKSLLGDHFTVLKMVRLDPSQVHATNGRLTVPPLFYACRYGHLKVCHVLIEFGADVHFQRQGWTCLHEACGRDRLDIAALLLAHHVDPNIPQTYSGITALMQAARHNFYDLLLLLLRHGADVWQCNVNGKTALDFATEPWCRQLLERTMKHELLWKAWACENAWTISPRLVPQAPTITLRNHVVEHLIKHVPQDIFMECLEYF